ncbi:MAG: flavin reductase family protein [Bryobacteraceae bacterium]|nr:flavin reductase family protein [Bryobacteraceae bacterium]
MFYEPRLGHGLPHDPFKACVAPRPIGWISTISREGVVNLAPFSYFNAVLDFPPTVMFSASGPHREGGLKDTARNAEETGEFVYNLATWDLRDQMNRTSEAVLREIDEFDLAGLEKAPSRLVKPPRVAASPVQLECRTTKVLALPTSRPDIENRVVFGEVVGVHIAESILINGQVDLTLAKPIARCGYSDYAVVERLFALSRP